MLDRSGSMSGEPLMYSKKACQFVADQMNVFDLLSLVAFDDQIQTIIPPSKITHKDLIKHRIESIETGGMTNLSGATRSEEQAGRNGQSGHFAIRWPRERRDYG
ncbi:VWA domain-containing protein [Paenibacillus nasutitermitis]|uniref:VWA domain-containing protein n=1 Tax=Paenibacillus nasutitermitis TaxID=1652958 RepID=UPI00227B0B2B|nr:VWA domain-containing protein [Paenibacillus nasutitermitis]